MDSSPCSITTHHSPPESCTHISWPTAAESGNGIDQVLLHLRAESHAGHKLLQELAVLHLSVCTSGVHRGPLADHHWSVSHAAHHLRGNTVLEQFLQGWIKRDSEKERTEREVRTEEERRDTSNCAASVYWIDLVRKTKSKAWFHTNQPTRAARWDAFQKTRHLIEEIKVFMALSKGESNASEKVYGVHKRE